MSIDMKVDKAIIKQLTNKFHKFQGDIINESLIEFVAERIKSNIFTRTNAGFDVNFAAFRPYNKKYAAAEKKTIVNLTRSGQMLNEMTQKALSNDTAKIFFMTERSRTLADIHNNIGVGPKKIVREFFGANIRDESDAQKVYTQAIKKAKEGAGL